MVLRIIHQLGISLEKLLAGQDLNLQVLNLQDSGNHGSSHHPNENSPKADGAREYLFSGPEQTNEDRTQAPSKALPSYSKH